jgi:cell division septum initiation protein DivIVA
MSASQPASDSNDTHDSKASVSQFPLVLRGYERHLVDARLAELDEALDTQRRRADEAEQALSQLQQDIKDGQQLPAWFASLGAEVRQVGEQAAIAAEQLLAEAGTRAQVAIHGAEAEAADRRRAAEEQASNLEQRARDTLAQAETERAQSQAEATAAAKRLIAEAETRAQEAMATSAAQAAARLKAAEEQATNLEQSAQETLAQAQAERSPRPGCAPKPIATPPPCWTRRRRKPPLPGRRPRVSVCCLRPRPSGWRRCANEWWNSWARSMLPSGSPWSTPAKSWSRATTAHSRPQPVNRMPRQPRANRRSSKISYPISKNAPAKASNSSARQSRSCAAMSGGAPSQPDDGNDARAGLG